MAGHHAFADVRARITADPARAERLVAAEQQVAEEQAAYDQAVATLERARALTRGQLTLSGDDVAHIERHTALYLATLQNYLEAMGIELEVRVRDGARLTYFTPADLVPPYARDTDLAGMAASTTAS